MAEIALLATLLGGAAALCYFRGETLACVRRWRAKRTLPQFAPGRGRSDGGSNELVIAPELTWTWTSPHQGQFHGSGRGEVRDGDLVLTGFRKGVTSIGQPVIRTPITFRLRRERDRLEGQLQAAYTYDLRLSREQ